MSISWTRTEAAPAPAPPTSAPPTRPPESAPPPRTTQALTTTQGPASTADGSLAAVESHLDDVLPALASLRGQAGRLTAWGEELARRLLGGHRLLVAGNGGSAAEAQHLTAELVGRFDGERVPFSALALHAESSAMSAIANDYGFEEVFARQVRAHGRAGDILLLLSTSGRSPNLARAAEAASGLHIATWALTGRAPNPLASLCGEAVAIDAGPASAQECHLIAIHAVCRAFDAQIARLTPGSISERRS